MSQATPPTSVRPVRLPDAFYLPRVDGWGREIRDGMPWEGAVSYATDGRRLGVQYADGRVQWIGDAPAPADGDPPFGDDFADVDLDALLAGLRSYVDLHPILRDVWDDDLRRLEALRDPAP